MEVQIGFKHQAFKSCIVRRGRMLALCIVVSRAASTFVKSSVLESEGKFSDTCGGDELTMQPVTSYRSETFKMFIPLHHSAALSFLCGCANVLQWNRGHCSLFVRVQALCLQHYSTVKKV